MADDAIWGEVFQREVVAGCRLAIDRGCRRILFHGERGTGKGEVAKYAHRLSGRPSFEPVNASTMPKEIAVSELFGHVKGAFTGATQDRAGLIRSVAKGKGTLFLDELDKLPEEAQFHLLRFLETGEVRPMGADRTEKPGDDLLILAAAKDFAKVPAEIQDRFDEVIFIPPLRERFGLCCEKMGEASWPRVGIERWDIAGIIGRAMQQEKIAAVPYRVVECAVNGYWPGNVRELRRFCQTLARAARDCTSPAAEDDLTEYHQWAKNQADRIFLQATGESIEDIPHEMFREMLEHKAGTKGMIPVENIRDYRPPSFERLREIMAGNEAAHAHWRELGVRARAEWDAQRAAQWQRCKALGDSAPTEPPELPWNLAELEAMRIYEAVNQFSARETQKELAARLGITPRTLRGKLKQYAIPHPWRQSQGDL